MSSFDPTAYGPAFAEVLAIDRCRELDQGLPDRAWIDQLGPLRVDNAFGPTPVQDRQMAECCLSGVWLLHDLLDQSHAISQNLPTAEGSFWHGIMHRREGDYSNAKYWFRRVGAHPVFSSLEERFGEWDPYDFVDRCEQAVRSGDSVDECRAGQQAEWELLFDWCYRHAV